jgi:hypothetical protein
MGAMSGEPRHGFFDPPRWMHGERAGLASGAFALGGVAAAIAALVSVVLLLAGRIERTTGGVVVLVSMSLCFLLLFLHRRAERFATVKGTDPRMPRDRTIAFSVAREGNWVRQALEGNANGFAAVHEDHLFVTMRRFHPEWMFAWYATMIFVREPRLQTVAFLVLLGMEMVDQYWRRDARHSWAEVRTVVSSGRLLVVEFAAADGRKDLVLEITPKDREKILPLLRAHVPVEVLPEPPKPDRPKREPPPPRPPKPPRTAIDGETTASLDRALEGIRKLRP